MDLCGPMRVASINGKKYILVIVDDYSRYTWTLFLRSKDETPKVLKDFLTMIQRNLQSIVISVRTNRGTEFLNKTLNAFFKEEGIEHQTSTPRTPEQNGVVERRNCTLVEAARTMLSASKLPLFFWAEAIATRCKKIRLIVESIHLRFDEIKEMSKTSVANDTSGLVPQRQKASDHDNPDPAPELQNVSPSADTIVPSKQELDLLFSPLYDEFFNDDSPSNHPRIDSDNTNATKDALRYSSCCGNPSKPAGKQDDNCKQITEIVYCARSRTEELSSVCLTTKALEKDIVLVVEVKMHFINGPLKEEFMLHKPDRFVDPDHQTKLLSRIDLYGLKQALKSLAKYTLEILKKLVWKRDNALVHQWDYDTKLDADLSGEPCKMYVIVQDIKAKDLTENHIKRSESFSDAIMLVALILARATSEGIQVLGDKLVSGCQEARLSYALSWKPCQGDSLNLPDHRIHKDGDGDASFQLKSDSLPHAHAQSTKTFYKHQDSRIMKAQELKTKTSAQTLIYKIFLQRYQVYQGRLLASFQDDAKYEHVGQDTRSQGGKDDQDKQGKDLKISDIKTKSKDNDKGSRSKITKHEGTSLQRIQRPRPQDLNDKSNLIDLMKECHNELTSGEIVSLKILSRTRKFVHYISEGDFGFRQNAARNAEPFPNVDDAELNIPQRFAKIFGLGLRGSCFPSQSLNLYAPFPSASITSYGPSHLRPIFPVSSAWLTSLLRYTRSPGLKLVF
ncbi:retrovirus-related pol polyprotein from transposon TNT 1-94 [Tanacetum coccineum]